MGWRNCIQVRHTLIIIAIISVSSCTSMGLWLKVGRRLKSASSWTILCLLYCKLWSKTQNKYFFNWFQHQCLAHKSYMYSNMPQNAGNHVLESFNFQTYPVNYPLKTPRGASYFVTWHACYESIVQFSHQLSSNYTPSAISNDNPASISCNHLCNLAPTFPMKNCVNSYLLNDGKNETMGDITFVITVVLNNFKTCFQRVENKKIVSY